MGDTPQPAPRRIARARAWGLRHERWIWSALIAVVLVIQWPMLKGYYYRMASTTPPESSIAWRTDLDAALIEAREAGKPVLVDFNADWCPPCIAMKHDVWPDPDVERAVTASYVPVMIDVDRDGATADRFGVRGIPTVLVLGDDGRVIREGSFFTAARMVRFLTDSD